MVWWKVYQFFVADRNSLHIWWPTLVRYLCLQSPTLVVLLLQSAVSRTNLLGIAQILANWARLSYWSRRAARTGTLLVVLCLSAPHAILRRPGWNRKTYRSDLPAASPKQVSWRWTCPPSQRVEGASLPASRPSEGFSGQRSCLMSKSRRLRTTWTQQLEFGSSYNRGCSWQSRDAPLSQATYW